MPNGQEGVEVAGGHRRGLRQDATIGRHRRGTSEAEVENRGNRRDDRRRTGREARRGAGGDIAGFQRLQAQPGAIPVNRGTGWAVSDHNWLRRRPMGGRLGGSNVVSGQEAKRASRGGFSAGNSLSRKRSTLAA